MSETEQPSGKRRVAFLILFIIGAGMFFVTTVGPLSGPAMSWDEAMVGLVPGVLLLLIGHVLHTRALTKQGAKRKATTWWALVTVFLLLLGSALVFGGQDKRDQARSNLDRVRMEQRNMYYGGYSGGYNDTGLLERDVDHYDTAVNVGYATLGLGVLFVIGTVLASRSAKD